MSDGEDVEAQSGKHEKKGFFAYFVAAIAPIGWLIIALGEFSDASLLLDEVRIKFTTMFTNTYEYEMIDKVHVGNTVSFIEAMVGEPQVSRDIEDGVSANYFFSDKYLLTLFYKEERVTAFTVLALLDDFSPEISGLDDSLGGIGEFTYDALPAQPELTIVDHSRVASYYLESIDMERAGRFLDLYMGSVVYGAGQTGTEISDLYDATVFGSDQEIAVLQEKLRSRLKPNLFGRGEITLEAVQKSLLSTSEFMDYFDPK